MSCGTDGFRFREKFCTSEGACARTRKPFRGTEIRLYPANGSSYPLTKGGLPTERGFGRRSFEAAFLRVVDWDDGDCCSANGASAVYA